MSGCTAVAKAAAAGEDAVLYAQGAVEGTYARTVEVATTAVVESLKEAGIIITSTSEDATSARVLGIAADDADVRTDLKAVGDGVTTVRIRVGKVGNRERAEILLSKIAERLN